MRRQTGSTLMPVLLLVMHVWLAVALAQRLMADAQHVEARAFDLARSYWLARSRLATRATGGPVPSCVDPACSGLTERRVLLDAGYRHADRSGALYRLDVTVRGNLPGTIVHLYGFLLQDGETVELLGWGEGMP